MHNTRPLHLGRDLSVAFCCFSFTWERLQDFHLWCWSNAQVRGISFVVEMLEETTKGFFCVILSMWEMKSTFLFFLFFTQNKSMRFWRPQISQWEKWRIFFLFLVWFLLCGKKCLNDCLGVFIFLWGSHLFFKIGGSEKWNCRRKVNSVKIKFDFFFAGVNFWRFLCCC